MTINISPVCVQEFDAAIWRINFLIDPFIFNAPFDNTTDHRHDPYQLLIMERGEGPFKASKGVEHPMGFWTRKQNIEMEELPRWAFKGAQRLKEFDVIIQRINFLIETFIFNAPFDNTTTMILINCLKDELKGLILTTNIFTENVEGDCFVWFGSSMDSILSSNVVTLPPISFHNATNQKQ
ncbi:hypothetical protein CR513_35513, partial [Mucuna pruriens]